MIPSINCKSDNIGPRESRLCQPLCVSNLFFEFNAARKYYLRAGAVVRTNPSLGTSSRRPRFCLRSVLQFCMPSGNLNSQVLT
jgi:hypothetical protein